MSAGVTKLAKLIQKEIFSYSERPSQQVRRIQFRGMNEQDYGGLSEFLLHRAIAEALDKHLPKDARDALEKL